MKTFLPQNKFNSASPVADDAAASSSPLPCDAAAALFCGGVESRHTGAWTTPSRSPVAGVAPSPQGTEVVGSVRTAASDLDQLADYFRKHEFRFAPDKAAIWDAMHDDNAPRVRAGDPVWADEPPLFLKAAI